MIKKSHILVIMAGILLCMEVSSCSRQTDFDVKLYVQSSLDANYHEEYVEYADLLGISEKEAREHIENEFDESIRQQFDEADSISQDEINTYKEKMAEIKMLAKYEVQDVEKMDNGDYTVRVKIEPSDVFKTLADSNAEVRNEKVQQGLDENEQEVALSALIESMQKSIEQNYYEDSVVVEVTVAKDQFGIYGLADTEMNKLESAMFPIE